MRRLLLLLFLCGNASAQDYFKGRTPPEGAEVTITVTAKYIWHNGKGIKQPGTETYDASWGTPVHKPTAIYRGHVTYPRVTENYNYNYDYVYPMTRNYPMYGFGYAPYGFGGAYR